MIHTWLSFSYIMITFSAFLHIANINLFWQPNSYIGPLLYTVGATLRGSNLIRTLMVTFRLGYMTDRATPSSLLLLRRFVICVVWKWMWWIVMYLSQQEVDYRISTLHISCQTSLLSDIFLIPQTHCFTFHPLPLLRALDFLLRHHPSNREWKHVCRPVMSTAVSLCCSLFRPSYPNKS